MDRLETAVRSIRLLTNQIAEHLARFRAQREELTEMRNSTSTVTRTPSRAKPKSSRLPPHPTTLQDSDMTHFPSEREIEAYRRMAGNLAFDTHYPAERRGPVIDAVIYAKDTANPAQMRLQRLLKAIHNFHKEPKQ